MTLQYRFVNADGSGATPWVPVTPGTTPASAAPDGGGVQVQDVPDAWVVGTSYVPVGSDVTTALPLVVLFVDASGNAYGTCGGSPGAAPASERSSYTEVQPAS